MNEIRKHPDFRPDANRGVWLNGDIDSETVGKLAPSILSLLDSPAPITLYLESQGGSTLAAERLLGLFRLPSQDTTEPHRLITVGLNICASAACDLLIAGDYALVYPSTVLLAHGVRRSADGMITHEGAASIAKGLALSNEQFAMQTAENAIQRFIFRFAFLRSEFAGIRETQPDLAETTCFLRTLGDRLSVESYGLIQKAIVRHYDNEITHAGLVGELGDGNQQVSSAATAEGVLLKCIIDKLIADNKTNQGWTFREAGLAELQEQFELEIRSYESRHQTQIDRLTDTWGIYLLDAKQAAQLATVAEEGRKQFLKEQVGDDVRLLWFIFVSLCRLLQKSENLLSAEDAYWLGLVDEVIGRPDLPSQRLIVEFVPSATDNPDST